MPVTGTDIEYRLSGGAANVDPSLSLGGVMSSTVIASGTPNALYDNVSADEATTGDAEYRCFYVVNTNATDTLTACTVYISADPASTATDIQAGLDPAGVGDGSATGVAVTTADEDTAPAGVVFSDPADVASGLAVGDLGPGDAIAVWVSRTVTAGASPITGDGFSITLNGTPV